MNKNRKRAGRLRAIKAKLSNLALDLFGKTVDSGHYQKRNEALNLVCEQLIGEYESKNDAGALWLDREAGKARTWDMEGDKPMLIQLFDDWKLD